METEMLQMPRMRLNTTLLYLYGWIPIASMALLAIPALLAGIFHDIRWLIVFLMICFILSPMLMAFLYFYHGMRLSTSSNVALHRLIFEPEGIKVTVYALETSDNRHDTVDNDSNGNEPIPEPLHSTNYPYTAIKEVSTGPDSVILRLSPPYGGFLWLPYTAFGKSEMFSKALGMIRSDSHSEPALSTSPKNSNQ